MKRSDALSVEVESYYTEDEGLTTGQSMAQILTGLLLGLGAQAPGIIPSGSREWMSLQILQVPKARNYSNF